MKILLINDLSLAAFMKVKDAKLLEFQKGFFIFDTEATEEEWIRRYKISNSYRYDKKIKREILKRNISFTEAWI